MQRSGALQVARDALPHESSTISQENVEENYDKYDHIAKPCKVCSTSVPLPTRARIAGLRATSFGDLMFVDHAEIKYRTSQCLVLLVIDVATNLLWATALATLEVPDTLSALRLWIEESNCTPNGTVGDQASFQDSFMDLKRSWNHTVSMRTKDTLAR